jgi:O-antigen ligase
VLAGGLALAVAAGGAGRAYRTVAEARATLASPDRGDALRAASQVVAAHPLGGAGPGHTRLRWEGPDGVVRLFGYAHNEYVQLAAELGLVGLGLLAILLAALGRLLWRARPAGAGQPTWAGVVAAAVAFAVHSGLDFTWHLPAVVLTVLLLVGAVLPPPAADRQPIPHRKASP